MKSKHLPTASDATTTSTTALDLIRSSLIPPPSVYNNVTQTTGIGAGKAANIKNCELCARKIAEVADTPKVLTRMYLVSTFSKIKLSRP